MSYEVKATVRTIVSSNAYPLTTSTVSAAPLVLAGDGAADPKKLTQVPVVKPANPRASSGTSRMRSISQRSRPRSII